MARRLTITLAEEVYEGLRQRVPRGQISRYIEQLVRPHVTDEAELEAGYRAMAADGDRERDAAEWNEAHPNEALE